MYSKDSYHYGAGTVTSRRAHGGMETMVRYCRISRIAGGEALLRS